MTKQELQRAGWISLLSAILTFPALWFSFFIYSKNIPATKLIQTSISLLLLSFFILIFSALKRLLVERFQLHAINSTIPLIIWLNVVLTVFSIFGALIGGILQQVSEIVGGISFFLFGLLYIALGRSLKRITSDLYGLAKPLSLSFISAGICMVTIVLIPIALVIALIQDIIFAKLFFRAAKTS